ncbi:hypothetical protein OBBRIDRAFT_788263 [Obba rivulosa]|uniref:Uncharacterized protein n=1 Tax=Obba rivulosa TaxID=1052685 RepID=A0A8E2DTJ0_9APHY|nr:hypothetical protein OBBRIDRAFT_788263 [Obba rivulosa]
MGRSTAPATRPPSALRTTGNYGVSQTVSVRIRADLWVIGVIVAVVNVFSRMMGVEYEIQYTIDGVVQRQKFSARDIRPFE